MRPALTLLLQTLFAALLALLHAAAAGQPGGSGTLERVQQLPGGEIVVSGWAAPAQPGVFVTNLILRLDTEEIYRGRFERLERGDVVATTKRTDWLLSGFRARVALPAGSQPGRRALSASMRLGDGREFPLEALPAARWLDVQPQPVADRRWPQSLLALAILLPFWALFASLRRTPPGPTGETPERIPGARRFTASIVLSFVLLVAGGWTGSSIGLLFEGRAVVSHDAAVWLGEPRPIRSDEWEVLTPLAISQLSHVPPFPVVNGNLGSDGQNMLVVGMTRVPVKHVTALVSPASWGFFVLDLRRALAWSWWFPFFGCFLALWAVLCRFFQLDWRLAAGLSLTLAAAPYAVVFSGWPSYLLFFAMAGLLAIEAALRAAALWRGVLAGAAGGLAAAGFALVLYPAWQISLTYLLVPFVVAWAWSRRKELRFGRAQAAAGLAAVAVAASLLLAWWLDARPAIASVRGTVYPGQRSMEAGGDIDRWFLLKGWLSPMTMFRDSSMMWGASDAGSVVLLLVPLFAAVLWRWYVLRRIDPVTAAVCAFTGAALLFMFSGFPPSLAKATLWGNTTSYRYDLALGAAQLLLIAALVRATPAPVAGPRVRLAAGERLALGVAVLTAAHAAYLLTLVPPAIRDNVPPSFSVLVLAALGGAGYLLMRGRVAAAAVICGAASLIAAMPFNPLGIGPARVEVARDFAAALQSVPARTGRKGVAVIGERRWSLALPAAGVPVLNSVFYYPQASFWSRLDPERKQLDVYNRYQRLLFVLGTPAPAGAAHSIDSPRLDEVRVTFEPMQFDFRVLGAAAVLAAPEDARSLDGNPTLRALRAGPEWTLFEVLP